MTTDGLSKMYKKFLDETSITNSKKAHLCRKSVPTIIEDMGYVSPVEIYCYNETDCIHRVTSDQVDATGHWEGNTRRQVYASKIPKAVSSLGLIYDWYQLLNINKAVVALAGFSVGETYATSWTEVEVPDELESQIFPFAENVLAQLRAAGCTNQGSINFLELLQHLRPFFWRVSRSFLQ